jgi:hypothetical protein
MSDWAQYIQMKLHQPSMTLCSSQPLTGEVPRLIGDRKRRVLSPSWNCNTSILRA